MRIARGGGVLAVLLTVLALSACRSRPPERDLPSLPGDEQQRLFRERASHEEILEFERSAVGGDAASRTRAVEMVRR